MNCAKSRQFLPELNITLPPLPTAANRHPFMLLRSPKLLDPDFGSDPPQPPQIGIPPFCFTFQNYWIPVAAVAFIIAKQKSWLVGLSYGGAVGGKPAEKPVWKGRKVYVWRLGWAATLHRVFRRKVNSIGPCLRKKSKPLKTVLCYEDYGN